MVGGLRGWEGVLGGIIGRWWGGVRRRNGDWGAEGGGGKRGERAEGSRREAAEGDTRGK